MAQIKFQFHKGSRSVFNRSRGWIVLGDHSVGSDGRHHLSAECMTAREVEEAANYVKKQVDRIVAKAKTQFGED
jgi:hypothetical protein